MIQAVFEFKDGQITIHSEHTKDVTKIFSAGYYHAMQDSQGKLHINRHKLKEIHKPFPNQNGAIVLDSIGKFLNPDFKETCNQMDYLYKMNILFTGKQGVGKTALITYICQELIDNQNAIVFRVDGHYNLECTWSLCENIREIQKNPIIIIMDEFEIYCDKKGEAYMKQLLDGARSIDYSMVFGATNYLDRVPETIWDRPSRFQMVAEVSAITDESIIRGLIETIHNKAHTPFLSKENITMLVKEMVDEGGMTVDTVKNRVLQLLMDLQLDQLVVNDGKVKGYATGKKVSTNHPLDIDSELDSLKKKHKKKKKKLSKVEKEEKAKKEDYERLVAADKADEDYNRRSHELSGSQPEITNIHELNEKGNDNSSKVSVMPPEEPPIFEEPIDFPTSGSGG